MFSNKLALVSFLMLLVCYLAHGLPLEKRGYTGEGTFYFTGLGSCGEVNEDSDFIAALNAPQMANGANPNHNPICGRKARVTGPKGSVVVKIVDTCPPCQHGDLDLSPGAFEKIADFDDGRVKIDWHWV